MIAEPETKQTDKDQSPQQPQTSPADVLQEANRIAALLRERFGTERRIPDSGAQVP
jgi:hypothetical protein